MWGQTKTSIVAARSSIGTAIATVTAVAASSWFHSPRRLAISQAASGRKSAVNSISACGSTLTISSQAGDVELVAEGRALEAEVERLGQEREDRRRGDEEDRQLARLHVDPAREPVRCSAASGIEAPAMNPATQAVACRARTSALR